LSFEIIFEEPTGRRKPKKQEVLVRNMPKRLLFHSMMEEYLPTEEEEEEAELLAEGAADQIHEEHKHEVFGQDIPDIANIFFPRACALE
jgi:hypothetical protein